MHAPGMAGLGVQRPLEHAAKDDARDLTPIEVLGRVGDGLENLRGHLRDDDGGVGEQTAVHVREGREVLVHVLVPLVQGRVDRLEQVHQLAAELGRVTLAVPTERLVRLQEVGVLGVKQEDDSGDEHVERALLLLRALVLLLDVVVLLGEGIVEPGDVGPGLDGELLLLVQAARLVGGQEGEKVQAVLELFEGELLHGVLGPLVVEVVEAEGPEVARHHPAGALGVRQVPRVPHGLLERRLHAAVSGLGFVEVDTPRLLLTQEVVVGDEHVDAAASHLPLEVDEAVYGVGRDAQDVDEQIYPELLRVLLLVVGARGDGGKALLPPLDELLCLFLAGRHTGPPASLSLSDNFKG